MIQAAWPLRTPSDDDMILLGETLAKFVKRDINPSDFVNITLAEIKRIKSERGEEPEILRDLFQDGLRLGEYQRIIPKNLLPHVFTSSLACLSPVAMDALLRSLGNFKRRALQNSMQNPLFTIS